MHASVAAKSGFFINLPVSSADFKLATSISGPDIPMLKGKGTIDRHMDYVDLTPQFRDGELLVKIDLEFIGHHVFLIGITIPFNDGIAIYIGTKKKQIEKSVVTKLGGKKKGSETVLFMEKDSKKPKLPAWMKDKTCALCQQTGHVKSVCPTQKCKLCRGSGHSASYCPRLSDAAKALLKRC